MKMNKTAAAITAGIITFGAMASASAAGIGFVNSGALLQAHPHESIALFEHCKEYGHIGLCT